jgi:hypothetical protein
MHASNNGAALEVLSLGSVPVMTSYNRTGGVFSPQGPTIVGTGNGTPEVPDLPSAWGLQLGNPLSGGYKYGEIECWRGPAENLMY